MGDKFKNRDPESESAAEKDRRVLAYAVLHLRCDNLANINDKGFQKVLEGIRGNIETAQKAMAENQKIAGHLQTGVLLNALNDLESKFGLTLTKVPEIEWSIPKKFYLTV